MLSRFADSLFYALHHYLATSPTQHCYSHTHVMQACANSDNTRMRMSAGMCRGMCAMIQGQQGNRLQNSLYDALTKTLVATTKNPHTCVCITPNMFILLTMKLDALDVQQRAPCT